MLSKKYWLPSQHAENLRQQSEMLRLKRLLQAGLWTIPRNLIGQSSDTIFDERNDFLKNLRVT